MIPELDGPVDLTPVRRASTAGSTGLDYSSCHRVDEDIISRIRSLILSRNDHRPPVTPHNSDEHRHSADIVLGFDFNSAKSVAKVARKDTGRTVAPDNRRRHRSSMPDMGGRRDTQPVLTLPVPPLRNIMSADDVNAPIISSSDTTPNNSKKKFRFPKLVLQDKKKRDAEIKSCFEAGRVPTNDAQIHEDELDCCPPCDPRDAKPSKYIVSHPTQPGPAVKIEPKDLACFLAGCPPGCTNCEKHGRRRHSVNFREDLFQQQRRMPTDLRAVGEELKRDVARMGLTIQGVPVRSTQVVDPTGNAFIQEKKAGESLGKSGAFSLAKEEKLRSRKPTKSPITISPASPVSSGSMDAFPLAAHYMEQAALETQPRFTTTVATNFSLPGYKDKGKSKRASAILRKKLSDSSLLSKGKASSQSRSIDEVAFLRESKEVPAPATIPEDESEYPSESNKLWPKDELFSPIADVPITETELDQVDTPDQPSKMNGPASKDQLASFTVGAPPADTETDQEDMPGQSTSKKSSVKSVKTSLDPFIDQLISSPPTETSLSSTKPIASDSIRARASEASMKSKSYTPSILSGASRTSAARHALLKPSVTVFQPVDLGLPLPPVLTPLPLEVSVQKQLGFEIATSDDQGIPQPDQTTDAKASFDEPEENKINSNEPRPPQAGQTKDSKPPFEDDAAGNNVKPNEQAFPVVKNHAKPTLSTSAKDHLMNLQKARELVDSVKGQIRQVEEQMLKSIEEQSVKSPSDRTSKDPRGVNASKKPSSSKKGKKSAFTSPISHALVDCQSPTEEKGVDLFKTPSPAVGTLFQDLSKLAKLKSDSPIDSPTALRPSDAEPIVSRPVDTEQVTVKPLDAAPVVPGSGGACLVNAGLVGAELVASVPVTAGFLDAGPANVGLVGAEPVAPVPIAASSLEPGPTTAVPLDTGTIEAKQAPPSPASLNAAYWGFVPAVKEAVQDAIGIAVRNAVQDIVVPPGTEQDKASDAYRKLMADSLAQAARRADEYLRRASLWNNPPSTPRDSEATVVFTARPSIVDQRPTSVVGKPTTEPQRQTSPVGGSYGRESRRPSVASKNQENEATQPGDKSAGSAVSPSISGRYGPIGSVPANFQSRQDLTLPPGVTTSGELETIPLETDDKFGSQEGVPGWKLSKAFKKGYTPIPTRQSSRNRVLSPKTLATNSVSKFSPQGTVDTHVRKRSFERLVSRAGRGLRSISSAGSLRSAVSDKKYQAEALVPPKPGSPPAKDSKVINTMPKSRKLSRKSTVHWLRDLLSNNGPYETRFTALPPRTRRDYEALNKTPRSQTAPVAPISNLFLGKTPVPLPPPKAAASKGKRTKRADPSETFSKTINDLENLMNEALLIARQAADSQDPKYPSILGSAVKVLKGNRKVETDAQLNARLEQDRKQSRISMLRCSGSGSGSDTAPSVHESLLSYSDSSDSDFEDEEEIDEPPPKRSIMVASINDPPKRSSGWPPTGRVSTPFPPASISPSRESPLADSPSSTDKKFSSATADRLHSADPRSLPTEIDVELRRQITAPLQSGNEPAMLKRTAARKMSVFVPQDLQAISSSEHSPFEILKPEFILEPFSRSRTEREGAEESRKSSAKSPKRLSPTRKSNVDQAVPNSPTANKCEDVVLDLCGDPCPPRAKTVPLPKPTPQGGSLSLQPGHEHSSEQHQAVTTKLALKSVPSKREVRDFIMERYHPPITPRSSSLALRKQAEQQQSNSNANVNVTSKSGQTGVTGLTGATGRTYDWQNLPSSKMQSLPPPPETRAMTSGRDTIERFMEPDRSRQGASHSFDGSLAEHSEVLDFEVGYGVRQRSGAYGEAGGSRPLQAIELQDKVDPNLPPTSRPERDGKKKHVFSLGGKRHLSLRSQHLKGFSFTRSHKRQAIARDWSPGRKRFVASVSCISTALIGILVGVYAGETPAIQYYIVDFHHYTVLGNVFFFIGLAVPTFLFWPLPLLHGRKPYILGAMSLAMPLLFPQALAVGEFRSPYVSTWRVGLILSRALMGFCLGFANMNFKAMLTDLFGASLQSQNPHQEHVDEFDVRRHGGGMGAWLGLWTWCAVGSVGFGFMIGAVIINHLPPAWGFYASIAIIAFVMLLNVLCPEVRRSAFRRSVAEVVKENAVSRRLARGEVKMHMVQSGPKWWGEEFHYGVQLSKNMLRQPGFLIMALYYAWIYGQMVLIISLLGALMSKDYKMKSPYVGASVTSLPLGALLAIPFQKASFLSRARNKIITSDDQTLKKKFSWSSHMLRRSIFILCLPIAGMAYTLSSHGPPIPFILPIIFAGIIGFLSSLALAECSGIIMETFDTSDLQPGMTGRPRGSSGDKTAAKRTNYSSFPRVQSAFAMTSGFGYLIAAAASGVGGSLTRHLGQQAATGIMAGILLVLSLLLLASLIRFTDVQIIPDSKKDEMDRYHQARRASAYRQEEGMEEEEPWRPVIIGNPHHHTRRMCLLELGSMSRFSEIRRKNKLVDEKSLEAKHPNRAAMEDVRQYIETKERELRHKVSQSLSRHGSRGSRTSRLSDGPEQGDLGGHREMLARGGSGKGSRRGAPGSGRKGTSMARKEIKEDE